MSKVKRPATQQEIYEQKVSDRRVRAALPVEEKIERLVRMQQLHASVARATGREYRQPWNIEISKKTDT